MVDYTQNEYHNLRHRELIVDDELREAWAHFADYAYFPDVISGMKVLEYGGGLGNNLLSVARRATAWMVEPSGIGRDIAAAAGIRCAEKIEDIAAERFDVILCRHVLEHVDYPLQTLMALHAVLNPTGKLVLVVPWEPADFPPVADEIDHHLYAWNPRALGNLLLRSGFVPGRHRYQFYGARRRLLPVYRTFGGPVYARAVELAGSLFRFRELVFADIRRANGKSAGESA